MESRKWRRFFNYYKWHLIFIALILICIIFVVSSVRENATPDLTIGYVAPPYVKMDDFENNKSQLIEKFLHDANDDDKKSAAFLAYTVDQQDDMNELLSDMVEEESYQIYITTKETFEQHPDKTAFATLYFDAPNLETLADSEGRIYAYSLKGNSFLKMMGILDTENLFITAANYGNAELSTEEKNGINIVKEIIEKRRDFN